MGVPLNQNRNRRLLGMKLSKKKEKSKCKIANIVNSEEDTIRIPNLCWARSGNGTPDGARDGNPI